MWTSRVTCAFRVRVDKKMSCKKQVAKGTEWRLIKAIFIVTFHQRFGMLSSLIPTSRLAYAKFSLNWTEHQFFIYFFSSSDCIHNILSMNVHLISVLIHRIFIYSPHLMCDIRIIFAVIPMRFKSSVSVVTGESLF